MVSCALFHALCPEMLVIPALLPFLNQAFVKSSVPRAALFLASAERLD
jgi:hypothetical protein